jgi:hypothetical protein
MNYFSKELLSMKNTSAVELAFHTTHIVLATILNGYNSTVISLQFLEGLTYRIEKYNVYDKQEQPPSDNRRLTNF